MTEETVNTTEKLDKIMKLLAISIIKDQGGDDQVKILYSAGLSRNEIASCIGKDINAVDQSLHRIKKSSPTKKPKKKKKLKEEHDNG